MVSKQRRVTKKFFDDVAGEWFERTYDPEGKLLKYPVNGVRKDVAMDEVRKLVKKGSVLDLGCGTGNMVVELLELGYDVKGIDVAPKMIVEAKKFLAASKIKKDPQKVFAVGDCLNLKRGATYDVVTGLGLLEYLEGEAPLLTNLGRVVKKGGYALVECRNKLFNLFSENEYTSRTCEGGDLPRLVGELDDVSRYSPIANKDIPKVQAGVAKEMAVFLSQAAGDKSWYEVPEKKYTPFPKEMVRQQHTPREFEEAAKKFGFSLEYVVYYHLHPYIPRYEKFFPRIFNQLSLLVAPLGQTSLGALWGSAFIGILKKK